MNKFKKYEKKINKMMTEIELYLINTDKKNYDYYYLVCIYNKTSYYNSIIE